MSETVVPIAGRRRPLDFALEAALVVCASLFVAFCARIYLPIPGTPVPLTPQNFAVLLVGLSLGSRRGFIAVALYLAEGAAGLPVFSPAGAIGIAHFVGPTGGYLLSYPFVAALTGYIFERGKPTFARAAWAAVAGEILLFTCGLSYLYLLTHSVATAISYGLSWFVFAEVLKVMLAAGAIRSWHGLFSHP